MKKKLLYIIFNIIVSITWGQNVPSVIGISEYKKDTFLYKINNNFSHSFYAIKVEAREGLYKYRYIISDSTILMLNRKKIPQAFTYLLNDWYCRNITNYDTTVLKFERAYLEKEVRLFAEAELGDEKWYFLKRKKLKSFNVDTYVSRSEAKFDPIVESYKKYMKREIKKSEKFVYAWGIGLIYAETCKECANKITLELIEVNGQSFNEFLKKPKRPLYLPF